MTNAPNIENKAQNNRTVPELIEHIDALITEIQTLYCLDSIPWIVGYSGGKDSTSVLQLIWYAILGLPAEKRTKQIYVITTDTLVENPIVSAWVAQSLNQIEIAAKEQQLPIEPHLLKPKLQDRFWTNLIGKGYPAPRHGFRWCTERLKIWTTNNFIRNVVRVQGEVFVILGNRKAESVRRTISMELHKIGQLEQHIRIEALQTNTSLYAGLPKTLIYTPIEDWRNDEVWIYLNQYPNPWGHSNKELFVMYRGATADTECPLVIDQSTPSCGDSRFGCWVCTMVNKDKSMAAMIQNDEEKEWMQPLLDIRNELDVREDYDRRDFRRMSGNVQLVESKVDGSVVAVSGPYTKEWREHWLRRVLEAQVKVRQKAPPEMQKIELISLEELSEIRRIWLEEKHEFDDSLPRIYREITGQTFPDPRSNAGNGYLGADEWSTLVELCNDSIHLELMNRLLDTERQFQTMSRRVGLYEELEKCCEINFGSKDETLENAHRTRNLKQAATQGDVESVKQLITDKTSQPNPTEHSNHPPNPPYQGGNKNAKLASPDPKSSSLNSPLNKGGWGGKEEVSRVNRDSAKSEPTNTLQPNSWAELKFGKTSSSALTVSESQASYNTENTTAPEPETEKNYRPQGIPHLTLKELRLQNFGPFQGQHLIPLTPSSTEQPIILIGGMNGGGKTTLMDAIRLALYGQRAQCSTRSHLSYSNFLKECVNRQTPDEPTCIELAFEQTLNNAPHPTEFRIRRTWNQHPQNGRDSLEIYQDGSFDAALTQGWDERIEDLLPLGISNLFLFDGEQVKELAEQDKLPPLVINAMRSLLGLELPDRLSTDLDVLIARKRKATANHQERQKLETIEQQLKSLNSEKLNAKKKLASIQPQLEAAQDRLNQAEETFLTKGGKIAAEQTQHEAQLQRLQQDAANHRQALRDLAAEILPLALIQPLLNQAQHQAQQEVQHQQQQTAYDQIQSHDQRLLEYLPSLKLKPTQLKQIQIFLTKEQQALAPSQIETWLGANPDSLQQLTSLLAYSLSNPIQQAREQIQQLQHCQTEIDATERYLATAASPEAYAKLKQQFQQAQAEVVRLSTDYEQAKRELEQIQQAITQAKQELVDYSAVAIEQQTTDHILKAAAKAQNTLKEFKKRLKLRKINQLEGLVKECFLYLLHKSNLIQHIQIDHETFALSLYDAEGEPIPKHRLSAGEKQLLAISLLWGLARASGRQLPIAIDTPLGRLDSSHRNNLVDRYFPQASHQVILLSTDTEIREEEVKRLRENEAITCEYLLHYDIEQQYTQIKPGYFW
jgi:DNA sulfur modification protein DndD